MACADAARVTEERMRGREVELMAEPESAGGTIPMLLVLRETRRRAMATGRKLGFLMSGRRSLVSGSDAVLFDTVAIWAISLIVIVRCM